MAERVLNLDGFSDASDMLRAGVYALAKRGVVIYVGKSKRMMSRIDSHRRKWIDKRKKVPGADWLPYPGLLFDQVFIRPCRLEDLDRLEEQMINLYKPRYNVQLKTSGRVTQEVHLKINGVEVTLNKRAQPIERRL